MKYFVSSIIIIILVFLASLTLADIPKLINYQGMLTNDSGGPLTGTYDITFKIYNASSGGDKRWEETQTDVAVTNGLFNVILGGATVSGMDLDFSEEYWLETWVDGEQISERLRFTSVGYAYRARWAERSDTADYAFSSPSGPGDYTWTFRVTDGGDTTITTGGCWGIARCGNTLFGNGDSTHVNLGVACITGSSKADYKYCTVGGGRDNSASGDRATVAGGYENTASGLRAAVGGGSGNTASGYSATVAGGRDNTAEKDYTNVGGGDGNTASGDYATMGGGRNNTADTSYATVGGGWDNTASGYEATVGGGHNNIASGFGATVGGGHDNTASAYCATVGGGGSWNTASEVFTTVGGGKNNTASGNFATVAGGYYNTASGNYSSASGFRAKANHLGTFVWADSSVNADFASTDNNQFLIRASGGVGIGTTDPLRDLHIAGPGFTEIQLEKTDDPPNKWHISVYNEGLYFTETDVAQRMTLENGGHVGIGTTNPAQKLDVNGILRVRGWGSSPANDVWVNSSGDLCKVVSSIRYKKNISSLEVDPKDVLKLRPVRFDWKETDHEDIGLIAEDVEQVIPDLVTFDGEGRPEAVKYDKVALYLLELVKSQQERISALEQEIAELKR